MLYVLKTELFADLRTWDIRNIAGSRARFVERFIRHGMTKERENAIEVQVHEDQKQAHDGDGRRAVVKNGSYGKFGCIFGRL